ncbi:MAG: condensation domain-containing protein, partial [Acidobacteriota bacterium]
ELRRHLREQLPDYMIPATFVFLDGLPLTANGKVDRRALPALGQFDETQRKSGAETDREDCDPNTPAEELLIGIWSQLLKLDRVGLHDNFFDLGGHSLLATQVMFRVRESLGVELPLRALFDRPTIAALGQEIEAAMRSKTGAAANPILPVDRTQPLPLSFAQHRLWFLDQLEPGSPFYNVPTALRISGPFSLPVFEQTLSEIVRRHESLRTVFQQKDGLPVQIIKPAQPITVPVTDLSGYPAEEREELARQFISAEGSRPFDLATGPLLRVQALKLGPEEYIVLSTAHHIVSDGWSMGVMIREVAELYEAYSKDEESPLKELPAQYGDYAVWQRERMTGKILEEQLTYWRNQLAGASSLALPTDRPRPPVQTYRGASQRVLLDDELSGKIKQVCQAEGVTLFMFLMGALNVLLYRYSGQTDIVIGTAVAGRTRSEVEGLIGFFVNSLALRTKIAVGMTFLDLLKDARKTFLDGYAHQELPFEKVVEELAPERAASRAPLFQVMFALQSGPQPAAPIKNLTLSPLKAEIATAKFDLTLVMANTGRNIHGSFEYNTDLFDAQTLEKMAGHFQRLLLSAVNQPDSELKAMEMFSEEEKTLLNTPLTFEELDHSFSF